MQDCSRGAQPSGPVDANHLLRGTRKVKVERNEAREKKLSGLGR